MTTTAAPLTANPVASLLRAPQPPVDDPRYFPKEYLEHIFSDFYYGSGIDMKSYQDYMLTEIQRGREIARVIEARTEISGKDVLDIGCGYGGLLIVMKEAGAKSLTGIEVDSNRFSWAQRRLGGMGYEAHLMEFDVCREDAVEKLGTFDIILAQDVIEHVSDPSVTIAHIARMLRPDGAVYMQVGNKFSPDQLAGDHHYKLPGITLLSKAQAIEYFCTRMKYPVSHYAVGSWRDEKFYRNAFKRHGVRLDRVDRYPTPDFVLNYAQPISEICTQMKQNLWPDLRPELAQRMRRRLRKLAELYVHAGKQLAVIAEKQPELLSEACDAIVGRMLIGVLRFVGRKDATGERA